uniref:F-box domain-containing protein n=1 Tax=Parastrongyloides trichosuri TaxID=131310 RepID=A0A0N4ZTX0_PARTI
MTFDELPDNVLLKILGYLNGEDAQKMSIMNKEFGDGCAFHNLMKHVDYCHLDELSIRLTGNGDSFFSKIFPIELSKLRGEKLKFSLRTLERPNKMLFFLRKCQMEFYEVIIKIYGLDENGTIKKEFDINISSSMNNMSFITNTIKVCELKMMLINLYSVIEKHGGYPIFVHIYQFNDKMMNILMEFINGCMKYIGRIEIVMGRAYNKENITILQNQYLNSTDYKWSMIDFGKSNLSSFFGNKLCSKCDNTDSIVVEYKKNMNSE